ncbi:MAG: nuclear transport factor 2 family protein [Boseongicola sp.]|nr:MAG: nuclear transport factor 2 family protein [Boseongicola sp.]
MSTQDIADKLYQHCRNHTEMQGLDELYAEDAVSVEPMAPEGQSPVTEGREGIKGKHEWWASAFEVHDVVMEGPFVNGDMFSLTFEIDATDKSNGQRWKSKEIALYEVSNGKIVRETFMMPPMG